MTQLNSRQIGTSAVNSETIADNTITLADLHADLKKWIEDLSMFPLINIARGEVAGSASMNGVGEGSYATAVTGADVWGGPTSTQPIPPSNGIQMRLVSSNAQDSSAGTGVRKVRMYYIDASGNMQNELVTMNGTTPVNTTATNIRFIQCMQGAEWGSGGTAAGNIDARDTGGTVVYKRIKASGNRCLDTARMVPAGKRLIVVRIS